MTVNALLQRVIFPHGLPHQILSDQGSRFRSELMRQVDTSTETVDTHLTAAVSSSFGTMS